MEIHFLGQPFTEEAQLGRVLASALAASPGGRLSIASAWAKRSGLSRIADPVRSFRAAGGKSRVIVGIDEGGATREGLELALDLFDEVFVYYDAGRQPPRTFHPKLYVVEAARKAYVLVGSGNTTMGGLFTNYEAGVALQLQTRRASDRGILAESLSYFDALFSKRSACRRLRRRSLDEFIALSPVPILLERRVAASRRQRTSGRSGRFGQGVRGLAGAPPPAADIGAPDRDARDDSLAARPGIPVAIGKVPAAKSIPAGSLVWSKKLPPADAQRNAGHKTGRLRLVDAGHAIDHTTYFRQIFFAGGSWRRQKDRNGNPIAVRLLELDVIVDGGYLGKRELEVNYGRHRVGSKGSHTTYLRWDDDLNRRLRRRSFVGWIVEIERRADGTYRLEIRR